MAEEDDNSPPPTKKINLELDTSASSCSSNSSLPKVHDGLSTPEKPRVLGEKSRLLGEKSRVEQQQHTCSHSEPREPAAAVHHGQTQLHTVNPTQCSRCSHHGLKGSPSKEPPSISPQKYKTHIKEKFVAREDLVRQIQEMGICRNGAVKALYWTGNKSAVAASNWIFDQPERDLDTPLEDELEMIRAQQAERDREEREKEEEMIMLCRARQNRIHHNHHHQHHHHNHHLEESLDDDDLDDLHEDEDLDEDDEDEDEDEEDDEEEEMEMEFKMVFVVNRSLELSQGSMALQVSRATSGLYRKVNSQAQSSTVGPDELGMWAEFGERTVILWADAEQHIKDLELMARNLQLPCHMLDCREGGGKAILGIFGEEREVNKVTGRLKVIQ